jgi:hypothetical protein
MSALTTAGSPSVVAGGLPGVVPCCSWFAGAAGLNPDWDFDPRLARGAIGSHADADRRVSWTSLGASSKGPIACEVIGAK